MCTTTHPSRSTATSAPGSGGAPTGSGSARRLHATSSPGASTTGATPASSSSTSIWTHPPSTWTPAARAMRWASTCRMNLRWRPHSRCTPGCAGASSPAVRAASIPGWAWCIGGPPPPPSSCCTARPTGPPMPTNATTAWTCPAASSVRRGFGRKRCAPQSWHSNMPPPAPPAC
ncbi:hypothetical protein D3C71_1438520 [compost metagenome]